MGSHAVEALVVDDEASCRDLMRRRLERAGVGVAEAPDGPTALSMLCEGTVHVVFLDIAMPGMNGFEVLEEIRSRYGSRVRVIFATVSDDTGDMLRAVQLGVDDYLRKPIDFDAALRSLRAQLLQLGLEPNAVGHA